MIQLYWSCGQVAADERHVCYPSMLPVRIHCSIMDDPAAISFTAPLLRDGRWVGGMAQSALCLIALVGCYAPMHSPGIPARDLPNDYRWPVRTSSAQLNYSSLVAEPSNVYLLGAGDLLEVTVPDLIAQGTLQSFQARVQTTGEIYLPRLGRVDVDGLSLSQAQQRINDTLAVQLLLNPGATVALVEKGTVRVLVLGAVKQPGVHELPRYENDVAHALAAAEGFSDEAGEMIEVHRRGDINQTGSGFCPIQQSSFESTTMAVRQQPEAVLPIADHRPSYTNGERYPQMGGHAGATQWSPPSSMPVVHPEFAAGPLDARNSSPPIVRIPLRDNGTSFSPADVILSSGDVVVVPQGRDKVFYVVGSLNQQSRIRFSVGDKDREIGSGLLLPDDREVDVVTAVAMAGYLDPIESPTTVTVHRVNPDGTPLLVRVDLIAARSDPLETILIQPGDIIYLNPDIWWYSRRSIDRILDRALGTAIGRWLTN